MSAGTGTPGIAATGTAALPDGRTLHLDLEAEAGEITCLVGPNGAGKSATLAVLLGLVPLTSGRIEVAGTVVADTSTGLHLDPAHRGLGWVPQVPALLPRRTVDQQVQAFARPDRSPALAGDPDASRLLARLRLDAVTGTRPSGLSGGQAQRVAVARALGSSGVVLFDEATSAQDPDGAVAVRALIRDHARAGGTALVVAHRPEDAWVLADQAIVLDDLTVVQRGTPADLALHPATAYVAQVAGVTVLRGEVLEGGLLRTAEGDLVVGADAPRGPAVALVRARAVTLHRSRPDEQSARNVVRSTVRLVEATPAGVRVGLDGSPSLTAELTESAAAELALQPGTEVWATCKAVDVLVRPA